MIRRVALLACTAFVASSCALVGLSASCDGHQVIGIFEQVGDLVRNANVQSSDVVIGSINDIELDGWNARVTMCINADEKIPADLEAVIRTTSLLGEKFVDLKPHSEGAPYLQDGDVIEVGRTSKATELEDVFARLASVLGTGNLEQINRFTAAQAKILRDNAGNVREVLQRLHSFTDVLADRKNQIATSLDALDEVSQTILSDSGVLKDFLRSFASSSGVLVEQKEELRSLLLALDRFTNISVQLLNQTEVGLNQQFDDLRPVLRTVVANSAKLEEGLQTLATFTEWFPETMPGDYLQLDVCQAPPDNFNQGTSCDQSVKNDDPKAGSSEDMAEGIVRFILNQPLRGES